MRDNTIVTFLAIAFCFIMAVLAINKIIGLVIDPQVIEGFERIAIQNKHAHYDKITGDLVWDNLEICSYLYRRECE